MQSVFVLVVLVLCSLAVTGQKKNITEGEFLAVQRKADDHLKNGNYRMTRTLVTYSYSGGPGKVRERFTREVLQPNKWRTVHELVLNLKTIRTEVVWDGASQFHRGTNDSWTKSSSGPQPEERLRENSSLVQTKYRYLGTKKLKGSLAYLYEREETRRFTDLRQVRTARFWYDPDGRLLQSVTENIVPRQTGLSRETARIEYDPKLVIESPISK